MNGPKSLASIVNQVSDDDLATISCDDALILYEGLLPHAGEADVDAALARLQAHIWDDANRRGGSCIERGSPPPLRPLTLFLLCS